MSAFSKYKQLEVARVGSNSEIGNSAANVVGQSHQRSGQINIANAAAALTEINVAVAPYAANLADAKVTLALAEVANATDYNVITLSKRTGSGSAVVMATANLSNVAVTAFVPIAFTVANVANAVVAAGDVITVTNAKTGNGVANAATYTVNWVLEDIA